MSPTPPQIDSETLEIRDSQLGTEGGPPGWMAFAIVTALFLAIGSIVMIVAMAF